MIVWGPGTTQKSENKKENNPTGWGPGKFSYKGVLEKEKEFRLAATKFENGKKTVDYDALAQSKGFLNNEELEAFKKSKPELYEAMGGINYFPKSESDTDSYKTHLSEAAVNRIKNRFKNYDESEITSIVKTLDSNKWQNADTMKKYSNTVNSYANDYIALDEMGYFNEYSEEDRKNNVDFFRNLKKIVKNSKDAFGEYEDENSYKDALRRFDLYNELKNSDIATARAGIDKWQKELDRLKECDEWEKNYNGDKIVPDKATKISDFAGKTSKEIQKMISEKKEILDLIEKEAKITKLVNDARLSPDFEKVIDYKVCETKEEVTSKYNGYNDFFVGDTELLVDYMCTDSQEVRTEITLSRLVAYDRYTNGPVSKMYYDWSEYGYDQLNEKEKEIVKYYAKTNVKKFQEYLDSNELEWKRRGAKEIADTVGDVFIVKACYAIEGGADRILQSFGGFMNMLAGDDTYVEPSKAQLTSYYIRENLDGFEGFAYDAIDTFTYMTPSLLMNAVLPGSGFVVTGITAAGGAYNDGINMGMSTSQARIYGALIGAAEACLEKVFSGVAGLTGKLTGKSVEKVVAGINSGMIKYVATLGINAFSEGFEEFSQEMLEPLFENIALGYDKNGWDDIDWDAAVYSGLLGMFMGGVSNMAPIAVSIASNGVNSKNNYGSSKSSLYSLVNNGLVMSKESDAYSRAVKAESKIEKGKNLSGTEIYNLATAIKSDMSVQNELQMIEFGMDENTAKELSPIVTKAVLGEQLTAPETEIIVNNETATYVVKEQIAQRAEKIWKKVFEDNQIDNVDTNEIAKNNESNSEERYANSQMHSGGVDEQFANNEVQGEINGAQKSNAEIYDDNQGNTIKYDYGYNQESGSTERNTVVEDGSYDENTSNAVTKPLVSYSVQKQSMIKSYLNSVDENLKSFVERVQNGNAEFERVYISDVSPREVMDIKNLLDIDVEGYTHNINTDSIRHILKRHGVDGNHDTSMSNVNDIARMSWVLENYDNVEIVGGNSQTSISTGFVDNNNKPAIQIRYSKKINGTYYLVEAAFENNYKKLWVQSAYLKKSESVTQANTASDNNLPYGHARSALTSPLSSDNISQNENSVNNRDYNKKSESVTRAPDASKMTPEVTSETEHASPPSNDNISQNETSVNNRDYNKKSESVTQAHTASDNNLPYGHARSALTSPLSSDNISHNENSVKNKDYNKKSESVTQVHTASDNNLQYGHAQSTHVPPLSSDIVIQNKPAVKKQSNEKTDNSNKIDKSGCSIFESNRDTTKVISDLEKAKVTEFANALGLRIEFDDLRNMEDNQGNTVSPDGYLERKSGIIHLNLYAENPTEFVLKHELTHFSEKVTEQYAEFADKVCESSAFKKWLTEKTSEEYLWDAEVKYGQYILSIDKSIVPGDEVKINREIVADFVAEMLFTDNGSGLPALAATLETKQRNIIVQYVLDFISWLKSKFSSKEQISRELALLEYGYKKLINEAVQSTDETSLDGETKTNSAKENAFSAKQDNSDISFCFVHCNDEEIIKKAEEMEKQGDGRIAIEEELGVMRGVYGDWVHILNIDNFRLYHYGTKSLEKRAERFNLKKIGGGIDCLLSDIVKWPELFEHFPKLKKFKVSIRNSAYSYDTARIITIEGEQRLFVNSRLLEDHIAGRNSSIKTDILREIQRLIQMKEGKYIGHTPQYWKDLEQKKQLPYSKFLGRRLTAEDMMKYYIDNYEAELAMTRQFLKEVHHSIDRKSGDISNLALYHFEANPSWIYIENDDDKIVSLEQLNGKKAGKKRKTTSENNANETELTSEKAKIINEKDFTEMGEAAAKIKDFVKSKEKSKKKSVENNTEIKGGNSGFLEKGIFDSNTTASQRIKQHIDEVSGLDIAEIDAIGRHIDTDIRAMMEGSFAVNKNGQPISVYTVGNSIDAKFKKTQIGAVVGTLDMALERFAEENPEGSLSKTKILENYAIVKNPFCLQWETYDLSVGELGIQLVEQEHIYNSEYLKILDKELSQKSATGKNSAMQTLKNLIKDLGFDSIIYKNLRNDRDSMSLVVFDPNQLIPVSEDGVLIPDSGVSDKLYKSENFEKRISNVEENNDVLKWALDDKNHIKNVRINRPDTRITVGNSGFLEQVGSNTAKAENQIVKQINKTVDIETSKTDTVGRKLARSIIKETEGNVFKNEKGELLSFFIWEKQNTSDNAKLVKKGTQFFDFNNAFNMYDERKSVNPRTRNGSFREFYLNAVSPLIVHQNEWNTARIADELLENKVINEKYYQALHALKTINNPTYDNAAAKNLRNKIELFGYDCIIFVKSDGSVGVTVFDKAQIIPVSNSGMLIENNGITHHNKIVDDTTHGDNVQYGVTIKPDGDYKIDIHKLRDEVYAAKDNRSKMLVLTYYLAPSMRKTVSENNTNIGYSDCFERGEFNIWHARAIYDWLIGTKGREIELGRYDTANRYIDDGTWQKLDGTILKTENGSPISLFLRNKSKDRAFKNSPVGLRLSTMTAAHDEYIAERTNYPYVKVGSYDEYFANIQNPYFMHEMPKEFTPRGFATVLYNDGIIKQKDYNRVLGLKHIDSTNHNGEAGIAVKRLMKAKGFDSIIYMNETLDPGSMGVVVFDESRLIPVSRDGIIINNDIKAITDSNDESVFLSDKNGDEKIVEISRDNYIDNSEDEEYNQISKIKCRNESLEGGQHPKTGVSFVKKRVEIYGEIKEVVVPVFEALAEVFLPERLLKSGRDTHNRECYSQLKEKLKENSELRKQFTQEQLDQLERDGKIGGYLWHHDAESGKMQLVNSDIHKETGHTGGYSFWGAGSIKK